MIAPNNMNITDSIHALLILSLSIILFKIRVSMGLIKTTKLIVKGLVFSNPIRLKKSAKTKIIAMKKVDLKCLLNFWI